MTRSFCFLLIAAVGCLPPIEEPADPSLTFPGGAEASEPLAELLVEGVSVSQDGPYLDVQLELSREVHGVQLDIGVDGVLFPVQVADAGGSRLASVRVELDPCATFGRSVAVTGSVVGSGDIVATMVDVGGVVATDGDLYGLTAYCDGSASFEVAEPTEVWIRSDGPVELEDRRTGSSVAGGQELAIRLEPGRYDLIGSGSYIVVAAE